MRGGYLERVVESGMTSLRHVRGSSHGAPAHHDTEGQQVAAAAAPLVGEQTVPEPARVWPDVPAEPALRSEPEFGPRRRPDAPLDRARHPSASLPPDMTSAQRDAAFDGAPATEVLPVALPARDAASVATGRLEARIEERRSQETAAAMRPDERGTRATAPSLKDAGIRNVLSRDEAPSAKGASRPPDRIAADDGMNHQRATSPLGHAGAGDGERPSRQPGVPSARVEQWQRLKDRLLLEHYPGTSKANGSFAEDEHNLSQPTIRGSAGAGREIVIEQLEVVVAAPHPAPPPAAPGPSSLPPRSGAWSVATRRYLGRL